MGALKYLIEWGTRQMLADMKRDLEEEPKDDREKKT